MRITITKLTFISVVLTLSLFICAPLATADDTDEQAQYDKAMDLISNWQGRDKNREEARKIALKMLKDNPNSARAYTVLGRVTWWMGYINSGTHNQDKVKEAQEYYHKALEADPTFREAEYYLAVSHVTAGNYSKALELADQLQQKHPDWPWSYYIPIKVDKKKRNHKRVLEACLDLIKRFPDDEYTTGFTDGHLVDAYVGLNMLDEADALHQKFVKESPDRAWTLGNYAAFLCDKKKDYDKAIEYAQKALAIMDYGVGRFTLARAAALKGHQLLQQNQLEEAEPYFFMALEKVRNFKEAWAGLAIVNYTLGKQNNDLERMRHAEQAASNAARLGLKSQEWAFLMMQIVTDMTKMENEAKQKPETKN